MGTPAPASDRESQAEASASIHPVCKSPRAARLPRVGRSFRPLRAGPSCPLRSRACAGQPIGDGPTTSEPLLPIFDFSTQSTMKNFINHIAPKVPFYTCPKPPLPPRLTASQSAPPQSQEPVLGGTVYSKPPFPPSHCAYYHLNMILYVFAKITPAGEVSLLDPWGDIEKPFEASLGTPEFDPEIKGNLGEIVIMKYRNTKLRCQLLVGGAGGDITTSFRRIIKSENAMREFAHDCKELCRNYGFDGIDIMNILKTLLKDEDCSSY
ncbi:hypothetical protein PSHT_03674, partial [Puccinia striiformis]